MENIPQAHVILGKHAIIDLSGCNQEILKNHRLIEKFLFEAAQVANITVVGHLEHQFQPEGFTAILLLEESHLSIHTWPEFRYVSIDLYSCNLQTNFQAVEKFLATRFKAEKTTSTLLQRGYVSPISSICINGQSGD